MVGLIVTIVVLSLAVVILAVTLWARGLGPGPDGGPSSRRKALPPGELDPAIIHRQRLETLGQVTGGIIHDFAFALIVGVLVGTYSSIFVASPILLAWQRSG